MGSFVRAVECVGVVSIADLIDRKTEKLVGLKQCAICHFQELNFLLN